MVQIVQKLLNHWLELLCFGERPILPAHAEILMKVNGRMSFILMYWCLTLLQEDKDLRLKGFFTFTHLKWGSWMPSVDFFVCKAATAHTEHRDNCKFSSLLENGPLNRSLSIALAASFQPSRLKKFGCCKANRDSDWCWVQAGRPCCCLLLHHNGTDNLGAFKQVPWSPHWHWINSFLRRN